MNLVADILYLFAQHLSPSTVQLQVRTEQYYPFILHYHIYVFSLPSLRSLGNQELAVER